MSRRTRLLPWSPTAALTRALVLGLGFAVGSAVLQRPDLLLIAVPFLAHATYALVTKPDEPVRVSAAMSHTVLPEGESTVLVAEVEHVPHLEAVGLYVTPTSHVQTYPRRGGLVELVDARVGSHHLVMPTKPTRWGRRTVGPVLAASYASLGCYRGGPVEVAQPHLETMPLTAPFELGTRMPHPRGLVGRNQSRRLGEGSEFATIRDFAVGDRLRRVHWARSTRSSTLQVRSTYADEDTHVALLVDATREQGMSGGAAGTSTNLDVAVRAAASVSRAMLDLGERVSLTTMGSRRRAVVEPGGGRQHHVRILAALARIHPGAEARPHRVAALPPAGTLSVVFSAVLGDEPMALALSLRRRGFAVVLVDCVGDPPTSDDADVRLAYRLRMLERDASLRQLRRAGVPVVPWAGAGSLDAVLREVGRR